MLKGWPAAPHRQVSTVYEFNSACPVAPIDGSTVEIVDKLRLSARPRTDSVTESGAFKKVLRPFLQQPNRIGETAGPWVRATSEQESSACSPVKKDLARPLLRFNTQGEVTEAVCEQPR